MLLLNYFLNLGRLACLFLIKKNVFYKYKSPFTPKVKSIQQNLK